LCFITCRSTVFPLVYRSSTMNVVISSPTKDDATVLAAVAVEEGGVREEKQRSQDTSDGTANENSVAETGESGPFLDPPPEPLQPQRSLALQSQAPQRRVDHTYRDYSNFTLDEVPAGKNTRSNFPRKLHQIVSNPDHSHIISWMPHGRAWKVHNKELFMSEVVPEYFVQTKYESFSRQLNGWGFKRLHQSGNDFNAYYHDSFLRGLPHLTALMKRVTPNLSKLLPHAEGEPNFYELDRQFPLPLPAVPYPGHYKYPSSHMASTHYASHPSSHPPPPPYQVGYSGGPPPAVGPAPCYDF